ncbi:MAG: DUF5794 domain-containing protein [Halodesulfurarchaeum sp.]
MSISRHPVALRLEQQVGGATRLLATVMLLPLIDGLFPALVLAGTLDSVVGIFQIGLLVFGGSATLAVIVAEMDRDPWNQAVSVLVVGIPLVVLAGIEAAIAPTIASLVNIVVFERFAAIVVVAIAAKTASATIGEYLPRPSVIIGLGAIASLDPAGFSVAITTSTDLVLRAVASGVVGVGFALGVVALRPVMEGVIDLDRFRFGCAVALGTLALSIVGIVPGVAPLGVFGIAGMLAFDPSTESIPGEDSVPFTATADGGTEDPAPNHDTEDSGSEHAQFADGPTEERVPWL